MYRILIVDDDASARRGIERCVAWETLNVEVFSSCKNGMEALEILQKNHIDVVVSDVQMPFMDGLELSRIIRDQFPNTRVLLISGYGEVDYLKAAINADVVDYILKPIKVDELYQAVSRAITELQAARDASQEKERLEESVRESLPLLRENFVSRLLLSEPKISSDELLERAASLGLDMKCEGYLVLLVRLNVPESLPNYAELHRIQLRDALNMLLTQMQRSYLLSLIGYDSIAVIDMCQRKGDDRYTFAAELPQRIHETIKMDVDVGLGKEVDNPSLLWSSLNVASQALNEAYFNGHNVLLNACPELYEVGIDSMYTWDSGKTLEDMLRNGNEDAGKYISDLYEQFQHTLPKQKIKSISLSIVISALKALYESRSLHQQLSEQATGLLARITNFDTIQELRDEVCQYIVAVQTELNNDRENSRHKLVRQIQDYIEEHFSSDITVKQIADAVHYSATYIANVFKNEAGMTINDALTQRRMAEAAHLLKSGGMKVYEVSEAVGYSDVKYFSKLFKKSFSVMPSEYCAE